MKLLLVLLSLRWAEGLYSPIRDPATFHVLFGNLADMSDLRLPPLGQNITFQPFNDYDDYEIPDLKALFKPINDLRKVNRNISNDVNDFNAISKRLAAINMDFHNVSYPNRRIKMDFHNETLPKSRTNMDNVSYPNGTEALSGRRAFHRVDWEESYGKFFNYESVKINKLKMLALGFLIHTRFKCDMAIRQRRNSRKFKAYKMGYVFNRIRRIQYNQAKVINAAHIHFDMVGKQYLLYYNLYTQNLRMYEKVIRLDVDMRDLIDLVYELHAAPDPVAPPPMGSDSSD